MIARLDARNRDALDALLAADPLFGGRIATALASGRDAAARTYFADAGAAVLLQGRGALLCGALTSAAAGAELRAFLRFCGVGALAGRGAPPPGFAAAPPLAVMERPRQERMPPLWPPLPAGCLLERSPSLWRLSSSGLVGAGEAADGWFADTCARVNRGLARVFAISADGQYVSTAGLYSLQPDGAYLTAVATAPAFCGRGLAGALIAALCAGRVVPVRLVCAPERINFYQHLGFAVSGTAFEVPV